MSILDLHSCNPLSRLVRAPGEDQAEALTKLRKDLKREYFKPKGITSMKKKGAKTKRCKNAEGPTFELVLGGNQHADDGDGQQQAAATQSQGK